MSEDEGTVSAYSDHRFVPGPNESWSNIFAFVPDGSRVLDVGCSTGNFGEALQRLKGCTVVGVDIDPADIAEAATKISHALVFDILGDEPLDVLGEFDVVVFADVLEHLTDPRAALNRTRTVLSTNGFVTYSIPNMTHASVRLDLLGGVFGYTPTGILDKTHLHFYDRAEVDDVFLSSGFSLTDDDPVTAVYPDALIEERLAELGLKAEPAGEFSRMLSGTDASILQFVGKAVPAGSPTTPQMRRREFPPEEINRHFENVSAERTAAVDALHAEQARADAEAARADAERQRAEEAQFAFDHLQARVTELRTHPVRFVVSRIRRR